MWVIDESRGPWTVNQTWNGIDWDLWSFGVCKPLEQACPNTEVGSTSVCGVPNKAGMCQRFTDPRHGQGSFCVASWNGTIAANLDGDGDRGLHVMYQPGDIRDEFRQNVNMLLNIECDPAVSNLKTEDIFVMPPFIVRTSLHFDPKSFLQHAFFENEEWSKRRNTSINRLTGLLSSPGTHC